MRLAPVLLLAAVLRAQEGKPPEAAVDTLSLLQGRRALWRSAALDGWGQAFNREWLKALAFSGGEAAIVAGAVVQHRRWRDWRTRRRAATDPQWLAYDMSREDFYLRDRNKLIWWWLWLKLGCTLDAYVSGAMSNFDAGWGLSLAPAVVGGAPGLELRWAPAAGRRGGAR
jgi:hypothetical protein